MINTGISDGHGSDNKLKVNGEGEIGVVIHQHPPIDEKTSSFPFRQYLTDTGLSTGDNDMRVDGSITPVEFWVNASQDYDTYVKSISVIISDAGATMDEFGALAALTNGVEFCWVSEELGGIVIHEGLTSNFDFVKLADGKPAFGTGASSFRANNINGTSEGYIPVIDLTTFSGMHGIRLRKGTNDRLVFKIQDNITTIDRFDAEAKGFQI
jgi:hypothetical protein